MMAAGGRPARWLTYMDIDALRRWIGRTETSGGEVTAAPMAALAATLDRDDPSPRRGDLLPLLWHWLYCLPVHRQSDLGEDGHARLGEFVPPVPLPRRMYAGGRVDVHQPLRVGDEVTRLSRIDDVAQKSGRTGPLVFVTVRHEISTVRGLALTETQNLVYRENAVVGDPAPSVRQAPRGVQWTREIHPDEVLLFRYSALTFNGHRIHFDRRFAEQQGYHGLVVHGPLLATLLADLVARHLPRAAVSMFSFRAVAPLFDGAPIHLCGMPAADERSVQLWAQSAEGALAMEAEARLTG